MSDCKCGMGARIPGFGTPGATFIPKVTETAEAVSLSWENNRGLPNPEPVTIPRGKDGLSAYEVAKDGGYTGAEEDFAAKLAEEYPQPDLNAAEGEPGHVLNRTHWKEAVPAVFDGDPTGRECIAFFDRMTLVKMSDDVLTAGDLIGRTMTVVILGETDEFETIDTILTPNEIMDMEEDGAPVIFACSELLVVCALENVNVEGVYLTAGTYYSYYEGDTGILGYVKSISGLEGVIYNKLPAVYLPEIPASCLPAIPPDLLPDGVGCVERVEILPVTWITLTDNAAKLPGVALVEGAVYEVKWNGTLYECTAESKNGIVAIGDLGLLTGDTSTGEPFIIFHDSEDSGTSLFSAAGTENISLNIVGNIVHKIPEEFLPEGYTEDNPVPLVCTEENYVLDLISLGMTTFTSTSDAVEQSVTLDEQTAAAVYEAIQRNALTVVFKTSYLPRYTPRVYLRESWYNMFSTNYLNTYYMRDVTIMRGADTKAVVSATITGASATNNVLTEGTTVTITYTPIAEETTATE